MKASLKIVLVGITTTVILSQAHAMRWYSPSTGRWFSRDPIQDIAYPSRFAAWPQARLIPQSREPNLYSFVRNSAVNYIDPLGLDTSTEPGVPHVSNHRDDNYLIFHIRCPKCRSVSNVTVDYHDSTMRDEMYNWYKTEGGGQGNPDPIFGSMSESQYIQDVTSGLQSFGGSAGFGGIQDPGHPNCLGDPVEVRAYMRTRVVAPLFGPWRWEHGTPDPSSMVAIYQENTVIHYTCNDCGGRGSSR